MQRPEPGAMRQVIAARLAQFPRIIADRADLRQASVAICITEHKGETSLLLIRRAMRLRAHAGQWALPGGRLDPGETASEAALREMAEEVGISLCTSAVLGLLDDYVTRSGYAMTPVVCWAGAVGEPAGAESEVAAVHQVPLADFDVEPRFISIPESKAPVIQLPLFGRYIHAPAAAIIHQFCRIACRGQVQRVAHYEQPVFAWR